MDVHDPKTLPGCSFTTSFTARIDSPVILNVSKVPDHEGTFIVIVARIRLLNLGGWKVNADGNPTDDSAPSPRK